jgi:diguanylate cyclase (GGDEF)-like protein
MATRYRQTSITTKLAIAALAVFLPYATLTWLVDDAIRQDENHARIELAGVSLLRDAFTIQHLLGNLAVEPAASILAESQRKALILAPVDETATEVDAALKRLEQAAIRPGGLFADQDVSSGTCAEIATMREAWTWFRTDRQDDASRYARETARELVGRLSECAGLALDPELASQMLARAALSVLPESDMTASRFQALALTIMAHESGKGLMHPSAPHRDELIALESLFRACHLKRILDDSRRMVAPVSPTHGLAPASPYSRELTAYHDVTQRLLETAARAAAGVATGPELFNGAARVRAAGHRLFDTAMDRLADLIQARIDRYRMQRITAAGLGLAGLLAVIALLAAASHSITRGVKALVAYTQKVAGGDYEAEPDSSDLGPRMRSMVADTGSMVSELKNKIGYLNGILHGMTVPCYVVDRQERLTFINQPYLDLYELDGRPEDYLGQDLAIFFYRDADHETITGRCMSQGIPISQHLRDTVTSKGKTLHIRFDVAPLHDLDRRLIGAFAVISDLTVIMEKEMAIERLAAFPREAPSPVLSAGPDGSILYMNTTATHVFDTSGMAPDQNFLPEGHDELVTTCLTTGTSRHGIESRVGGHHYTWTYHPLMAQQIVHMYATDITKRVRAEGQLLHNAFHDALTGLPNKSLLLDRVKQTLRRTRRRGASFALLFLDLDGFKNINDGLGHGLGDKLLARFAWRIKKLLGPDETLARLGGDEFTVLLPATTGREHAMQVANRIQGELQRPFDIDGHALFISVSIGIINAPEGTEEAADLLRDAETAMYRAKAAGRGRSETFDPTMHTDASERISLENDLKQSLENHEFEAYYQPIIAARDRRIAGFEALVRWNHPIQGVVSPARFIPIAEETGLIVPMGAFMMEAALVQTRQWQESFPAHRELSISVNVSVVQLTRPTIGGEIRSILSRTGIDPRSVKIEITESGLMNNVGSASELLAEMKATGVSLMIDDFGTGYSSLSHLHQFPFHFIKIDQSFVGTMEDKPDNMEIVRTIISLAHALGKKVVAEGVETRSQLDLLAALGCEFFQGYYFSPPLAAHKAEDLLSQNPTW